MCSILSGFGKTGDRTQQTHLGQRSETGPGPLKRRPLHLPRGPLLGAHWAPVPPRRVQDQKKPVARWGMLPARNKQERTQVGPTTVETTHQGFYQNNPT